MQESRVVVLGGGYAGATVARGVARQRGASVTLIDRESTFHERVRGHHMAVGRPVPERPFARLPRVRFVQAAVAGIDLDARAVRLDDGRSEAYDRLVVALGSGEPTHDLGSAVAGIATRADVLDLRDRLERLPSGAHVVVIGGGLTGIECVTEIAAAHPGLRTSIVHEGELLPAFTTGARRHVREALDRLRVTHVPARADGVRDGVVTTTAGPVHADLVVWAAGFGVSPIPADAGLDVDADGRVIVDPMLRSVSHPEVIAVGDVARATRDDGVPARMSCQTATQLALATAANLRRSLRGTPMRPVGFHYYGQNVSLGPGDAVSQWSDDRDRPRRWATVGRAAAAVKRLATAGAAFVAYGWTRS